VEICPPPPNLPRFIAAADPQVPLRWERCGELLGSARPRSATSGGIAPTLAGGRGTGVPQPSAERGDRLAGASSACSAAGCVGWRAVTQTGL